MGKTIQVFGFPFLVPAEAVKCHLEKYTGNGSVYALEVKQSIGGSRAYARVQFTDSRSADVIIFMARDERLYYRSSYLKAWEMELDMVPRPRVHVHEMECLTLNFGCQVSSNKFAVLWKKANVSVKFGIGLKNIYFNFCIAPVQYKLELLYENIRQIMVYRPCGQTAKFLLIQLFGAPRIFKRLEASIYSYFVETHDDQWVRTTDFTPSCIGQSSGICLELPHDVQLPNFADYFAWYKESEEPFVLENGSSYSSSTFLVPIMHPPQGLELPFAILFKICILVQTGCLPGPTLDENFFRLVQKTDTRYIEHALEILYNLKECCYEPVSWITEQFNKQINLKTMPKSTAISSGDGLVYVRRALVTPCKVYFRGPEVNLSNRVLRNYPEDIDNFLRVSFVDEEWDKMISIDLLPRSSSGNEKSRTEIYDRILSTLKEGIVIGDKKFEFLAFSSSQLRENSVWMFASRPGLNVADIRAWMGDFSGISNVAKYAARLGQSFSSSTETLSVRRDEIEIIPDIVGRGASAKYTFSDGIGKVSADFARRVAIKCGLKAFTPSAFQIRYGGFKGVVAVDPTSTRKLPLRKSMEKYDSDNIKLDVLSWSKYLPCFLNRQIITLLSTLGIKDHVFEKKQRESIAQLDKFLTDPLRAYKALELVSLGGNTNTLKELLKCGSMMGCLDETSTLEYGEVFVQYSSTGRRQFYENYFKSETILEEGRRVLVAKNPCLHPGDIRVLKAVNVPALHHMVDCVIFPQRGTRPHPDECSGSDLDGDIYFVCWDPDLIPPRQVSPMDYTPAPTVQLDHEVTIEEIEEYFTNYIVNNSLGIISNAHTVFADMEPEKAMSRRCLALAELFSIAVDFPKTGVPAEIPSHLRVKEYPDFMEKPDKTTYLSENVIGKLFREVKDKASHTSSIKSFTREMARRSYDTDLEIPGFEEYIDEAFEYKTEYDYKLGNLMDYYGIKTEAEILSGGILKMSRSFDRKRDAEAVSMALRLLRKEARSWFKRGGESDEEYEKASAWYHVTYHPRYWGCYNEGLNRDHYISFPWVVHDKLVQIKKDNLSKRRNLQMSSLEWEFNYGLRLI